MGSGIVSDVVIDGVIEVVIEISCEAHNTWVLVDQDRSERKSPGVDVGRPVIVKEVADLSPPRERYLTAPTTPHPVAA